MNALIVNIRRIASALEGIADWLSTWEVLPIRIEL
jgi:hypothetical protein